MNTENMDGTNGLQMNSIVDLLSRFLSLSVASVCFRGWF